jgi:hypothetical protein
MGITRIASQQHGNATLITIVDNGKTTKIAYTDRGKFTTEETMIAELKRRNGGEFSKPLFLKKKPDGAFKIAFGEEPEDW